MTHWIAITLFCLVLGSPSLVNSQTRGCNHAKQNDAFSEYLKEKLNPLQLSKANADDENSPFFERLLIPMPQKIDFNKLSDIQLFRLGKEIKFHFKNGPEDKKGCDLAQDIINIFNRQLSKLRGRAIPLPPTVENSLASGNISYTDLKEISAEVLNSCHDVPGTRSYPSENMDEKYTIEMKVDGIIYVTASEIWGMRHAFETLIQLVYSDSHGANFIPLATVQDFPRFKHRGFLLDSARHFLTVQTIKKHLDAMAMHKMNVFHWHIVDDQSFPYQSRIYPNMSELGSFKSGVYVYSQTEILDVINYSRQLGIRVIAEFDTPGHTASWGKSIPYLLTPCYDNTTGKPNGNFGPINPTLPQVYDFLQSLMGEITQVFPDNYLHLGGDEVDFTCWKSNPDIRQFMQDMDFGTDYSKLESYYLNNLIKRIVDVGPNNQKLMVWQEVFDNGDMIPPETLVHVWKSESWQTEMSDVTKAGYTTVLSSCWYLDYISYGEDWVKYFQCEPTDFNGSEQQKNLVIGGEGAMWSEYVDNNNVIQRIWPRASAVAERLWSAKSVSMKSEVSNFHQRLQIQQCRLASRDIPASPVTGPSNCQ